MVQIRSPARDYPALKEMRDPLPSEEARTSEGSKTSVLKMALAKAESGLDWLICYKFPRQWNTASGCRFLVSGFSYSVFGFWVSGFWSRVPGSDFSGCCLL